MSLCFLAMLSFPLYSASPVFYMQNSCIYFFVSVCVCMCVCLFVSVRAAVASEKPILQACQIQSQYFWRKCTSLLPHEWICCNAFFKVCLIIFEEHQISLYLHSKFTRQLCKGNLIWFVQYLT